MLELVLVRAYPQAHAGNARTVLDHSNKPHSRQQLRGAQATRHEMEIAAHEPVFCIVVRSDRFALR